MNEQAIKANQEGGLGLCSRMVARLDFKARATGAVDARGIKAKQDERTRSRRMGGWADGWTCQNFRRDFAIVSGRMVRTLWAACLGRRIRLRMREQNMVAGPELDVAFVFHCEALDTGLA